MFRFNGELTMLQPANVILNGLDNKIYKVSDEFDIRDISPYHKYYKGGNLCQLFLIKGVIQVNLVTEKLNRTINQDSYVTSYSSIHTHYKDVWKDYTKMVLIYYSTWG